MLKIDLLEGSMQCMGRIDHLLAEYIALTHVIFTQLKATTNHNEAAMKILAKAGQIATDPNYNQKLKDEDISFMDEINEVLDEFDI